MTNKKANRLVHSKSPYLLQHAYNPVDWYPWSEEAHRFAQQSGKPILLSIGYSACHWCHVMERESFENEGIAQLMNNNFVCIKVDREERPDIDQIYMDAVQAMGGQGGWPLTVFLTPDLKPVYGGTYFPPESFKLLIQQISAVYQAKQTDIKSSADQITLAISATEMERFGLRYNDQVEKEKLLKMYQNLARKFDPDFGGMLRAPKFPMPGTWKFLLHFAFMFEDKSALAHTLFTLDSMASGGLYDQLGGGFARYSTDRKWHVPHFEKMLYDNGQLMSLYSGAYSFSAKPRFREILYETLGWLKREMTSPEGGFYSALDADSEGVEGKFYVWSWEELEKLAAEKMGEISQHFGVTRQGNWEKTNILLRIEPETGVPQSINEVKKLMLEKRNQRIRPGLDDKIITAWNALMSSGLVDAYNATGDAEFIQLAQANAHFIENNLFSNGNLFRTWKAGTGITRGFLEDYACSIEMYLKLYQATFHQSWLDFAIQLTKIAFKKFYDKTDNFFFFAEPSEDLIVRKKEILDNVIPGSNSTMANSLYKLGILTDNKEFIETARKMTFSVMDLIESETEYASNWAMLYSYFVYPTAEVAIVGEKAQEFGHKIREKYFPNKVIAGSGVSNELPLLAGKEAGIDTKIYVCQNYTCGLPVDNPATALEQMKLNLKSVRN